MASATTKASKRVTRCRNIIISIADHEAPGDPGCRIGQIEEPHRTGEADPLAEGDGDAGQHTYRMVQPGGSVIPGREERDQVRVEAVTGEPAGHEHVEPLGHPEVP